MKTPAPRIITDILVCIAVLVLPWWLSGLILIALIIYFPLYLEGLFFAFLFDTLYASRYAFPYIGLIIATVFLFITIFVKTRIRR